MVEVSKIVKHAETVGAQEAEVIRESVKSTYSKCELGEPKETILGRITEYALRVMVDGAVGFAYFTDNWEDAAREAVSLARTRQKDESFCSFVSNRPVNYLNLYRKSVEDVSVEQLIGDIRSASEAAQDKKVVASDVECQIGCSEAEVANSCGVHKKEHLSLVVFRVMCRAADSDYGMGYSHSYSLGYDIDFCKKGEEAKEKALSQLGKQRIEPGNKKVILTPRVFSNLITCAAMPSFLGDNLVEGRSSLHLGDEVASEHMKITEDPLVEKPGGRSFDDEGVPSQKVDLISEKRVKNFLYDSYYGETTANAVRYSRYRRRTLREPPRPCATSLVVNGESAPLDELISEVKDGLLVVDETNSHASKTQSGLFSIAVTAGFIVEKGEITSPVKRCMVSGLAFEDLLPRTVLFSRERELHKSSVYPTHTETGAALVDPLRITA